jgi:beta-lactamase superfamily II metal-dependent hydrolase
MNDNKSISLVLLCVLVAIDASVWFRIFAGAPQDAAVIHFLDVGQGDAILLELEGGVKILTDAGPTAAVVESLERVLPHGQRYIDLAIITHPETDHFKGFNDVLDSYRVGAFITNGRGRESDVAAWKELLQKIGEKRVPLIVLGEGDGIRYKSNRVDILSPNPQLVGSSELNDAGLVQKVRTREFSALLTADIGFKIEEYLLARYDLSADILKAGHHGSKYSSGAAFLRAVGPSVVVVSAGARNSYGHPAPDALARLSAVGATTFRTDRSGNVTVRRAREEGELKVFVEK